ncbi:hypothetical protein LCGC14_0594870 [marine sediment metagenome]|uniref:Uncharacterized protein n=1 Tax=marine sediment metagenome TaxID=412755 RepID=A0A0F9RHA3_9ZZZZ
MSVTNLNEEEPQDILNRIEEGEFNNLRNDQWVQVYSILLKKCEDLKKNQESIRMLIEIRIHSLGYNHIQNEFYPLSGTLEEFSNFTNASFLQYSKSRAMQTQNNVLKARYSDIVWEFGNTIEKEFALISINSHLKNINYFYGKENYAYFLNSLSRAFYLAFRLDDSQKLKECLVIHLKYIDKFISSNLIRWTYDLLQNILKFSLSIKAEIDSKEILRYLDYGKEFYSEKDILFYNHFSTLEFIFKDKY